MLARKETSLKGQSLPDDWNILLKTLLNENYKSQCELNSKQFDVYGRVYSDELLIIISLLSQNDPSILPITLALSCEKEHFSTEVELKKTQQNYLDIIGLIYDDIFSNPDWNEFEPLWQELKYKDLLYFYKITRENIALSIEASKLLGEDY